jgi:O-antigen/teichoic acid export membrane protein
MNYCDDLDRALNLADMVDVTSSAPRVPHGADPGAIAGAAPRVVRHAVHGAIRGAVRGAAVPLVVAVAVQSAGNLGFHAVVGRLLPADSYGALGAVLAAMVMLGVPLGTLQAAAAALVAEHGPARATTLRVLRSVAVWSVVPAGGVLLAAPAIGMYFHLSSLLDSAQLAPYLVVAALLAAARGLLLGDRRVGAVAVTYLVGTGVRLGVGLGLVGPYGVSGALIGTLVGEAASLAVAIGALARIAPAAAAARALRLPAVVRAATAVTGLFLFSTVDLLLARHHLRGAESGAYVAAATVAKTVLALPAAVMAAVFPRLVAAWPGGGRARALVAGGVVVVAPALVGAGAVIVGASGVLALLYGDGYAQASALVRTLSAVAALTSVVSLMTYAALARRSAALLAPWGGAALEVVVIQWRHGSAAQIAFGSVVAVVPTLVATVALEIRAWRGVAGRATPNG